MRPLGVAAVIAITVGCGGDDGPAVCGDGDVEGTEQCDDGDDDEADECRLCVAYIPAKTIIRWVFNADAAPGFTSDGCNDVGSTEVRVDVSGPATASKTGPCPMRQVSFDGLPAGTYTASVTPLDSGGTSLVSSPVVVTFETTAEPNTPPREHLVVVPPEQWANAMTMTGTYFFMLRWGGMPCDTATPPVVEQSVTVRIGGVVTTRSTSSTPMYSLDGSWTDCVMSVAGNGEYAQQMPFGAAEVEVVGRSGDGAEVFEGTFETFIGAGVANPTLTLDVPAVETPGAAARW